MSGDAAAATAPVRLRWRRAWNAAIWLAVAALPLAARTLPAQDAAARNRANEIFVGSELEDYLRLLQVGGDAALYPWSVRGFSPRELARIAPLDSAEHPWAARHSLRPAPTAGLEVALIRPSARLIYNSAFPYGFNDGPVWAGRGVTSVVEAGFSARYGPVSVVVAPTLFRAENADFPIAANGRTDSTRYGDATDPFYIDLPQRYGEDPYLRVDPGQSTIRVDLPLVTAGLSTASQQWGPAIEHPIILGPNAPGFLHGFAGTATPWNLWIARVHGRMVWGRLEQSAFSDVRGVESDRFMSGIIGVITPRGLPGLEVGVARFFHTPWPKDGLTVNHFAKPVETFLKAYLPSRPQADSTIIPEQQKSDADNQIASVFARWVLPRSGFEFYGEFGRDDHNYNLRDFVVQTDHASAYTLGFRKLWKRSDGGYSVLHGEVLNAQPSHLLRVREEYPLYIHGGARQGHTQRGQLLGSYAAHGGSGAVLAFDRYSSAGRASIEWRRIQRRELRPHLERLQGGHEETAIVDADAVDLIHSLALHGARFVGPLELFGTVAGAYNLNRDFGPDEFNLNLSVGVTVSPGRAAR